MIGVDVKPQRHYPFRMIQADVMTLDLSAVPASAIHASPPCKAYTVARTRGTGVRQQHPDLIGSVRLTLLKWGGPYVIENVVSAPLLGALLVCGGSFNGLSTRCADGETRNLQRHRLFETNAPVATPGCNCGSGEKIGVYGYGGRWHSRFETGRGGYKGSKAESSEAMGINWMTLREMCQAIPPAYTEYIGRQLLRRL